MALTKTDKISIKPLVKPSDNKVDPLNKKIRKKIDEILTEIREMRQENQAFYDEDIKNLTPE